MQDTETSAAAITLLVLEELAECGDGNIPPARHELSQEQFNRLAELIEGGLQRVRVNTIEKCALVCSEAGRNWRVAEDNEIAKLRQLLAAKQAPDMNAPFAAGLRAEQSESLAALILELAE